MLVILPLASSARILWLKTAHSTKNLSFKKSQNMMLGTVELSL